MLRLTRTMTRLASCGSRLQDRRQAAGATRQANDMAATRAKRQRPSRAKAVVRRPLLVVDGDSFAHRAYHGLPKTIRSRGGRPGGAILGFANLLLRLYGGERRRAVVVGGVTHDQ